MTSRETIWPISSSDLYLGIDDLLNQHTSSPSRTAHATMPHNMSFVHLFPNGGNDQGPWY